MTDDSTLGAYRRVCNDCGKARTHDVTRKDHGGTEYKCRDCGGRVMHG